MTHEMLHNKLAKANQKDEGHPSGYDAHGNHLPFNILAASYAIDNLHLGVIEHMRKTICGTKAVDWSELDRFMPTLKYIESTDPFFLKNKLMKMHAEVNTR